MVSNRRSRAASLGLAGVVFCLAAFSIVAAYTMRTQVDIAQKLGALHGSYDDALAAIREEETAELEFLLDPSLVRGGGVTAANEALLSAIADIEQQGGRADADLASDIRALQQRFFVASERVAGAMAAGDLAEARRVDSAEADPLFEAMHDEITVGAAKKATEDDAAFADLQSTARWLLILTPIVFAIGSLLLIRLWWILDQDQRATRKTYEKIEQLSKLRSEFVSIVSHEFRTPLTGIQGFSELMRDEELTAAEVREYASDINKDAQRLNRLLNDMLDLDRMETGEMKLNVEAVDVSRLVADAAAKFRLSAGDHPIELHLDERLPMLKLMGDWDRLTQVLTNLLSNAIKYSPAGGAVELTTRREAGSLVLTVRDHGIGIAASDLVRIFERYSGVQSATTRVLQGTGLGLPIVRQIVQLHKGTVWATSESGDGSVFHVQLPAA